MNRRRRVLIVRRLGVGSVGAPDSGTEDLTVPCGGGACKTGEECAESPPGTFHCRPPHACEDNSTCLPDSICVGGFCHMKAQSVINPGSFGDNTPVVGACNSHDVIVQVQTALGVDPDGQWRQKSQAALDAQGGNFKDFAPGCTGSAVPHWTQSGGNQPVACKDEGKPCAASDACCGDLVCNAGLCGKPPAKDTSPAWWWIFGGLAFGAALVGVAYATGSIGGPRKNPSKGSAVAKHGGYKWAMTYEIVTEESAAEGDAADRGWEHEWDESPVYKSLADLLNDYDVRDHGWLEWSSSHPRPHAWIVGAENRDSYTGDSKSYDLFIRHADGTDLTMAEIKYVNDKLGLRGQF